MLRDIEAIQEHTISESTIPDRKLLISINFSLQVLLALSSVRRGRVFAECHSVSSNLGCRAIPSLAAITLLAPMSQDAESNNIEGTGQRL